MPARPPIDRRCPGLRWAAPALAALLAGAWGSAAVSPGSGPVRPAAAQAGGWASRSLGLAHVDVMDLHVARLPDGAPVDREVLTAADLADRFRKASEAGVTWDRWSLYWDMVERSSGYDWSAADAMVTRDVSASLSTLAILQGTPSRYATSGSTTARLPAIGGGELAWARLAGAGRRSSTEASPPQGLDSPAFLAADGTPTDDPRGAAGVNPANPWARFVDAAVGRYRPGGTLAAVSGWTGGQGVRAWEIGNEPDLEQFWNGTAEQYARYLEVAYLAVKRRDPDAVVVHGGIADSAGAQDWFRAFLGALTDRVSRSPLPAAYGYYFDKTAWHWYTYPALLSSGPKAVRSLLAAAGLPDKAVWVTELGVPIWNEYPGPCWDPTSPWRATAAEQAAYVWLALTEAVSADVEALVFFQTYDDCGNGPASYDAFGLVRNHVGNQCWIPPGQECWRLDPATAGMPRPAFGALQVAAEELASTELLWRPGESDGWERVLLYRPPDERVTVAWNQQRADRAVELSATGSQAVIWSLGPDGSVERTTAAPQGGAYALTLPGATNRNNPGNGAAVMAGRPLLLVERDTVPPFRAQVEPLPDTSAAELTLTVSAADGGTGVAAFEVYAWDSPDSGAPAWQALGPEHPWPGPARGGQTKLAAVLPAGHKVGLAARALDRAGNWSALPDLPQALTTVVAGTATPAVIPYAARAFVPVAASSHPVGAANDRRRTEHTRPAVAQPPATALRRR